MVKAWFRRVPIHTGRLQRCPVMGSEVNHKINNFWPVTVQIDIGSDSLEFSVSCAEIKIKIQDLIFLVLVSNPLLFSMHVGAGVCAFQFLIRFISFRFISSWFFLVTFISIIFSSCTKAEHVKNTFIHSAATPLAAWRAPVVYEGPDGASLKIWNDLNLIPSFQLVPTDSDVWVKQDFLIRMSVVYSYSEAAWPLSPA
jgi:hypothetical protein